MFQIMGQTISLGDVKRGLEAGDQRIQYLLIEGRKGSSSSSSITISSPIPEEVGPLRGETKVQPINVLHRGISLGLLIALTEAFQLQNYPTYRVVKEFITPVTSKGQKDDDDDETIDTAENSSISSKDNKDIMNIDTEPCRFAELDYFQDYFGKADTFVSHCWNGKWGDLVSAVSSNGPNQHALSRKVWIDIFAVTQHPQMDALQDDLDALQYVIENVPEGTTLVWNPSIQTDAFSNPVLRAWCLFEIHTTLLKDNALLLKMGRSSYNNNTKSSSSWLDFIAENNVDIITKLVFETDIRNAKATMPQDLERIHAMIQASEGFDELNTRVRTAVFNNWRILQIPDIQAALSGSKKLIRKHLDNYDRASYEGDDGGSMLHDLVHGNLCTTAELVIECGAPINHQTDKGNTPLMFAAEGGRLRMCHLLVQKGNASLDLQNEKKETALMLASKYGRVEVVKFLLDQGADVTLEDNGNYTAEGLARMNKMPGCKEVLLVLDPSGEENTISSAYNFCCCFGSRVR